MAMIRSYQYRIYPSKTQAASLGLWLKSTRELYNAALTERQDAWKKQQISISLYDQQLQLKEIRKDHPALTTIPVVVLRGALNRLNRAFAGFFRRCHEGDTPGFPRFKGSRRWNTLEFDNSLVKSPIVAGGKRIAVPLLGKVKIKLHRPLGGRPRTMKITLKSDGKWYVGIVCDNVKSKPLPKTGKTAGIDLGLLTLVATSDGELLENPRPLREARLGVERASRRVSRRKQGGRRRKTAVRLLAKKHIHVVNIRKQNHIDIAKALVAQYDTIFVEKLNIKGLASGRLAKSINDAAWGGLLHWLRVKAEEAEREVVEVNPRGTSQMCSGCGVEVRKDLGVRTHSCPDCGLILDRDVNAARNILGLGMSLRGAAPAASGRQGSAKFTASNQQLSYFYKGGLSDE